MKRDRRRSEGPRKVSESLETIVRGISPQSAGEFGVIFGRWDEIVGARLAAHVQPVRATADALVVAADHPAWATQVRALGTTLLAEVAKAAGRAPRRLEVVIRRQ
jgi:predicted nucleic acid-binding Zn ribbon protein